MESKKPGKRGRFRVSWTTQSAVRRVEIIDCDTGRRMVGSDWASWDAAYKRALVQLTRQPT